VVGNIPAQNMKQSGQSDTQLHFHKNYLYVKTGSRIFLNTKSHDKHSSNRTVSNLIHSITLN